MTAIDPTAAAVGALGAEMERLKARIGAADAAMQQLTELWEQFSARNVAVPAAAGVPSWLAPPDGIGIDRAAAVLDELNDWLRLVFLRFPDGRTSLPECWLQHPDVIEELLWLRHAWAAARHPKAGSPSQVADWHDRLRPGVVRRIRGAAGTCAPETHLTEAEPELPEPPSHGQLLNAAGRRLAQRGTGAGS